jgi:hypothetical protein
MSEEAVPDSELLEEESEGEIDDDFLYHLYQGGELLQAGRVEEAKAQLEKAFDLSPKNSRGQNMLGLVYFKLGLFDRAIEIYRNLVDRFPQDGTLRVNLAMVYFKAQKLSEARAELEKALEMNPKHEKAHRYLGLVLVEQGDLGSARPHFAKAGVKDLDRFMGTPQAEFESREESAVKNETANAEKAVSSGADPKFHELEEMEDALFHIQGSTMTSQLAGKAFARLDSLLWVDGAISFHPVLKRFAGEITKHSFDSGAKAVLQLEGEGKLGFSKEKGKFFRIPLPADKSGFFLEERVVAYSDASVWENGRLQSEQGGDIGIFHLDGPAELVLSAAEAVSKREVKEPKGFRIKASRLLGWTGDLVPKLFAIVPAVPGGLWLEFSGNGEVYFTWDEFRR